MSKFHCCDQVCDQILSRKKVADLVSDFFLLNTRSQTNQVSDQGANYKKNLKIILRCDNNLR